MLSAIACACGRPAAAFLTVERREGDGQAAVRTAWACATCLGEVPIEDILLGERLCREERRCR